MKKSSLTALTYGILFLLLIQSMGSLVEAIYILDLLKTSLDEKALGLLFFFAPLFLYIIPKKPSKNYLWFLFALVFLGRGFLPFLPTIGKMITSGIATAAGLLLLPLLLTSQNDAEEPSQPGRWIAVGLAFALLGSILLRTVNYSLDYSLQSEGGWLGWVLAVALGILLKSWDWKIEPGEQSKSSAATLPVFGIFIILALSLFAFSAPAVMARWTDMDYRLMISAVAVMTALWAWMEIYRFDILERIPPLLILLSNGLFTLTLSGTLLASRVAFPPTPSSPAVIIDGPTFWQQVLLLLTVLLFPVILLDLHLFIERLHRSHPSPQNLAGGMLLGSLALVILIFMQIFTNVWGYVAPVSPWFRNKFFLPYLLMAALLTLLVGWEKLPNTTINRTNERKISLNWSLSLAAIVLICIIAAFLTTRVRAFPPPSDSLVVMTYNIQQANDANGERSFKRQLAQIEKINPDILALQESDSARVSLNNTDIVRYYAGKLGYYAYYGPSPVSGTYGTAILSKYPLHHTHVVYSYSDKDEIGTTVAEIEVAGKVFTIYDVHPDGTETAMMVFAQTLLQQINGKEYAIALGDYNLRENEKPYQLISETLTNAWESLYPTKISPDGIDMSGENRIDHIFFSTPLKVRKAVYILPPDSATDHPLHWAELYWEK